MKLRDYLRLGVAGIAGHKRQTVMILIVIGALYSVLMAGVMLIQGVQSSATTEMTRQTDGKILVQVHMYEQICKGKCSAEEAKAKIRQYGGEVLEAKEENGILTLDAGIFGAEIEGESEVKVTYATVKWLAKAMQIKMPSGEDSVRTQMAAIEKVREWALGKTIESNGEKYYIAGILPGSVYTGSLAFSQRKDRKNPLNMILGMVDTGWGEAIILENEVEAQEDNETVVGMFEDVEQAIKYMESEEYCQETGIGSGVCSGEKPRYIIGTVIPGPVSTEENFRELWEAAMIVAGILMVIASIVMLSTYGRLIGKDRKIIRLYRVMGARKGQIVLVYIIYLVLLSLMAAVLAMIVGAVLAVIVNMVNMGLLEQAYALGFGADVKARWIIGWNVMMLGMVGVMVLTGVVSVILNLRKMSGEGGAK